MEINRQQLTQAVDQGLINAQQAQALWQWLSEQDTQQARFRTAHILYYLGGFIAISAMASLLVLGWTWFGGWAIVGIALLYLAISLGLTQWLLNTKQFVPAGVMATFAVSMVPLLIYGIQIVCGWWDQEPNHHIKINFYWRHADWREMMMEAGALLMSLFLLYCYRLPFLVLPVVVVSGCLILELGLILYADFSWIWMLRLYSAMVFGVLATAVALLVEFKQSHKDYAFWLYQIGVLSFWIALSSLSFDTELGRFFYLVINLVLIGLGAILSRRIFVICGGLGSAGYLGYLVYDLFSDSVWFPFALTFVGFAVVALGIVWQKYQGQCTKRLMGWLPFSVSALLARRHIG